MNKALAVFFMFIVAFTGFAIGYSLGISKSGTNYDIRSVFNFGKPQVTQDDSDAFDMSAIFDSKNPEYTIKKFENIKNTIKWSDLTIAAKQRIWKDLTK